MPIYDYRCSSCDALFERLVRGGQTVACPRCSSLELQRLISLPARPAGSAPQPDYGRLGPPATGGCCGGSCHSHPH